METILLVITVLSVAAAVAALLSARKVQRRERERSEARVAALSAAADTHGTDGWTRVAGEWQWTAQPQTQTQGIRDSGLGMSAAREGVVPVTEPITNPQPLVTGPSDRLFGTVERDEPSSNRLPMFAAAALIVMLGGALIFLNTSASNDHAATVAQVSHAAPLELVSLGHARDVSVLTISGTVRNPASGVKVEGLTAVVSLLDRTGVLVSTKDVPLDYRALGPGEEAPFRVSIPDSGAIARYRVSFRAGADVVPHVDRRSDTKLASAVH
jgi:type II secretory pathway pseudopilin PulG